MSLQQELDRLKLSFKQKIPTKIFQTINSVIKELDALGIEHKPLKEGDAITEEEFNTVVKVVSPVVGDMLKLVWYTAMRPYEVCDMKPSDTY